ncbi:MAG: DUF2064 domain-containing protein [Phycisphaerales bacterium]|nr:MAG: DUF2064 domain-containing protein [Phycisphaerales bacterium]
MRNGQSVAVIIPALDEEATIARVIARVPEWADRIIVVDNGSTDTTASTAFAAGAEVVYEPVAGYGRACLTGIAEATGKERKDKPRADILVFLDADGSDEPEQMDRLVDPIASGQMDMVIGSRTLGDAAPGSMTPPQRVGNRIATFCIKTLWGVRYTDLGPFRAIRGRSLESLAMDDAAFGWTVQMQIRASKARLNTAETPVDYARRAGGNSKISGTVSGVFRAGKGILGCVAREYMQGRSSVKPREALGVFAKYPSPGKAKTRLIPALGADGAAELHEQMLRHALRCVDELASERAVETTVWQTGAEAHAFAERFAPDTPCRDQTGQDLGERMHNAFVAMLSGADRAIIVGTDCPEISPGLLEDAFDALGRNDLVLGPAADGGYYLVGLKRPAAGLFQGIAWGAGGVLRKTLSRAASIGLKTRLLTVLSDVDHPEDIGVWRRVRISLETSGPVPALSVIIPTLNEAERIGPLIDRVKSDETEVIVADGQSDDATREIAAGHGARVVIASKGRGRQMDAGAKIARGRSLLFLHADTELPEGFARTVERTLRDPRVAVGAFRFALDARGRAFRVVEAGVRLRCKLFKTPYGDQALFLRADTFRELGGFGSTPIMEDLDLVRRAAKRGRVRVVRQTAVTSARRWKGAGVLKVTVINRLCVLGRAIGIPASSLAAWRSRARSGKDTHRRSVQIEPTGSGAPSAERAISIAGSEVEAKK